MKLVAASQNWHKVKEIRELLADLPLQIAALGDLGPVPDVVEDGATFQQNAAKKALEIAKFTGELVLADDSGLEVDVLKGAPGVFSARYAGEPSDDRRNNEKLLKELDGVELDQRGAQFRCVIALASPQGKVQYTEGVCRGLIGFEPRGDQGFGYDPLFIVPLYNLTFAQLAPGVKNEISHRALALRKMKEILKIKAQTYY